MIALVIALLIKNFVVQAFYIPSPSMEHTLNVGDKVLVNKLVYDFRDIQPGDVVVFNGVGSWDPVPAAGAGQLQPARAAVRRRDPAAVPVGDRVVRHSAGAAGLHQAGHRGAR